ncbi:MAG TPA: lipoxygenase family protein [Polyangiales bacterium]|nr:lipoxygenase family protein [Polyangiales bacterium]
MTDTRSELPSLPQDDTRENLETREFQLSLARTAYNYMRTYPNLGELACSANIPSGEELGVEYNLKVVNTVTQLAENFVEVLVAKLGQEFAADIFTSLRQDIAKAVTGTLDVFTAAYKHGPTAFLRSTFFDMLNNKSVLQPKSTVEYEDLIKTLPKPQILTIDRKPGMPDGLQCDNDWFFGYLQVAGFNTTCLRAVVLEKKAAEPGDQTVLLEDLLDKMDVQDRDLRSGSGDDNCTLKDASRRGRLFVCDYELLRDAKESSFRKVKRFLAAPIALFYWNDNPPRDRGWPDDGYGGERGVLQPIAIQLKQERGAAIFTPHDSAKAGDADGRKWRIAKYIVNMACVIQHESVAHLGECHMVIEPIVLATHRQLAKRHPLFQLLLPHLRYTISINSGSRANLIVPGGVVATNVGPEISSTLELIVQARKNWRWDQNRPDKLFALRGVDSEHLPVFPFRDDTLPLWEAIKTFVQRYVRLYYANDRAVEQDGELQAWINEIVSPEYAALSGFDQLRLEPDGRVVLDKRDYLEDIVAQIIYIAGPLHASVNFAQYPLGAYAPAACGVMYKEPPTRDKPIKDDELLSWYPPLDVALYTVSFVYLLSGVQFDRLGHYSSNPREAYFKDRRAQEYLEEFQNDLALVEHEIRRRNRQRPVAYPYQLPSQIPNSISI